MNQLEKALDAYKDTDMYPFHMPGHKRQSFDFPNPYTIDITEIEGFDNLHHASGILAQAQKRGAELYGSRECFYLVNGSTCGILAAVSAAVKKGQRVLVARNCHKAVYHALFLRELRAEYLYPSVTAGSIQGQITPEQVEQALLSHGDIAAVIITSPTYEGIVSDIEGIARAAHARGVPLIVDEAHGAHFGFGGGFPENAVRQGADAVIMSLHKTMPAFTQTALLHLCTDRISGEQVKKYLGIYETSSPSYVLMAGMDSCIRLIREEGARLFLEFRKKLDSFYQHTRGLKRLHVMVRTDLPQSEAYAWDDSKIVIFTGTSGLTGKQLYEKLLQEYHLQMEMVSLDYVLGMTSVMDREEGFERLAAALKEIDEKSFSQEPCLKASLAGMYGENPKGMELSEAWEMPVQSVPFSEAAGKLCGDYIYLYPPGIPMIVPGEVITESFLRNVEECRRLRLSVEGSGDLCSGRINVVSF